MSGMFAWKPSPGPLYTALTSTWSGLNLPSPPTELTTWIHGTTPLSTNRAVVASIATYLLVVFGGREFMRNRQPYKLTIPFQIHNIYLTLGSGILLLLMLEEIIPLFLKHGFFWTICNSGAFTPRLVSFYMVNYYIKYVELIDTVFLVLKKKPLQFLHVFHHAATAILCFTQLEGETSVQWVVITLNLTVHVIMYYYYYATAGGAKIWWKRYLTTLQITQFVIDLFITYFASTYLFSYRLAANHYPLLSLVFSKLRFGAGFQSFTTYNHFAYKYTPLPVVDDCAGGEGAAMFGCGLLTSYLFLFIAFYRATYKKAAKDKAAAKAANGSAIRGSAKSKIIVQGPGKSLAIVTEVQ